MIQIVDEETLDMRAVVILPMSSGEFGSYILSRSPYLIRHDHEPAIP
jgi:hypothetical protein